MTTNKRIIVVLCFISMLFLALLGWLTYFVLVRGDATAANPYNRRNIAEEESVLRGAIYDRAGVVLAKSSVDSKGKQTRRYSYNNLYSGVIGYNSPIYGKSGLEKSYNNELLGRGNILGIQAKEGHSLHLTIDHDLQQLASNQLGNRKGAVVAVNPQNGDILALAGYPNFNPNEEQLVKNWKALADDENSPFVNRAVNGLYEPGSTFKIITAAALLVDSRQLTVGSMLDEGSITIDGKVFRNFRNTKHGEVDLKKAFAVSSNVAFCLWGSELGGSALRGVATNFGFESNIDIGIPVTNSRFPNESLKKADAAAAAMGQWKLLATPIQMAKIAAVIANGGSDVPLHLVDKVVNKDGGVVWQHNRPLLSKQIVSADIAGQIAEMMAEVVKSGTGTGAKISGVTVAGKTGTAENNHKDKEHAWFVAFAPAENPTIAVAVCLENSGRTGSEVAVPIARSVMARALGK
ncbi:MAG: penicillin-binding transpeptidase domain-containing protein [Oscillospiraceae bacterium]|nr:penicillin-binding transpeptidase domain-containing protein [Oscillospiraceae bacterium]